MHGTARRTREASMRIGFDVDDVVADLHTEWVRKLNEKYGKNFSVEDMTQWDFWKDMGLTELELYSELLPSLYENVKPCPGALAVVRAVRQLGHSPAYITTCHTREMWVAKSDWLIKFGFLEVGDTAYPVGQWSKWHSKGEVAAEQSIPILVDDNIPNCENWIGTAYLLTRPHNRRSTYYGKRLKKLEDLMMEIKYFPKQENLVNGGVLHANANGWIEKPTPVGGGIISTGKLPPWSVPPTVNLPAIAESLKATNPKDAVATDKVPLHFVSGIVKAYASLAHFLGNIKYGAWNYRAGGARASVYLSALQRHMDAWQEGEKYDPVDGTPHLANALACINILIEASENGNLTDDRPPSKLAEMRRVYAEVEALMPKIRDKYKDRQPKHYCREDSTV